MTCAARALLAFALLVCAATAASAAEPKRVLLLHSFGPQFVPWVFFAGQFREELFKHSPDKIDLYEASLEGARFQQPDELLPVIDYLTALFEKRKLDLIVTIGAPASTFVQKYRAQLFPSVPLVIGGPEQRTIDYAKLTPNDAPVPVVLDFKRWLDSILEVLPGTAHIAWIVGASPLEKFWTEEFRRVSQPYADRISFEYFNDLTFEGMQARLAGMPPHSAAFFVDLRVDAAGVPLDRESVLPKLRAATNAPIFSYVDNYLGQGIVGGPMISSEELGKRMAEAAIRIFGGEVPGDLKIPPLHAGKPQYDWRELQHWAIAEDRLPSGSIVRFREPDAIAQYRWYVALVAAILLVQGALISGLLFERRRRRLAEVQVRQRSIELAHINRYTMAGELAATIAHELNQPLGAILTNAETAELMVKSPAPDLNELAEILADIRRDDERAGEVIGRLRSQLRKTPFEPRRIDLNEVARDTLRFLAALSAARNVALTGQLDPAPLAVKGDAIQLQQVIVNLIMNAMDAMAGMPGAERVVTISSGRQGDFAELSVADDGPGIAPDKLKEIFAPFFTTKPQGIGMGLAIARTIVEAHGGQLLAENKVDGGAIFRIRLPLAPAPE